MRGAQLIFGLLFALVACSSDPTIIVKARCENDEACGSGLVCEDGECVPRDAVSCVEVEGGRAILQPNPARIDFGVTGSGSSDATVLLRNIGNCTVTVFEASLAGGQGSPFDCPACQQDLFPLEIFPFRENELRLFFTPSTVGPVEDDLVLLSDDTEFSEIRIPVRATFNGIPAVAATPDPVEFDFAAVGRTVTRTVRLQNRGTGVAPLEIRSIAIDTATASAFSFDATIDEGGMPIPLRPIGDTPPGTPPDELLVQLRYHPQEVERHTGDLVLQTNLPRDSVVRVPLAGSSKTPAKIAVSPGRIEFGPVLLGQTTAVPLTIVNEGGTPLRIQYRWGGTGLTTDFSVLPQTVPAVPAGSFTEIQVLITATSPSPLQGLLILQTNDPTRPTVTIPVSAIGQPVVGAQVVKVDMNFENGADGTFDDDFRNVDMALENPFGLIVNKQFPQPTNWNAFGNPTWLGFGAKEEPERIVLPDAQQDGTYRVLLSYAEDCSSVPSGLVAVVLGISVEALIAYLTGGSTLGIGADRVSEVISDLCLSRSSSAVTLTISINGTVVAEVPATLQSKDDFVYAADIVRANGQFSVRP
ncbi:MAG: choice-of-anchor D domain-containing protein [Myxococcota bacterium]